MTFSVKCKLDSLHLEPNVLQLFAEVDVLGFADAGVMSGAPPPTIPGLTCARVLARPRHHVQGGVACYVCGALAGHAAVVREHDATMRWGSCGCGCSHRGVALCTVLCVLCPGLHQCH